MGNGERSSPGGRSDWPVKLAGMAGAGVGGAIALLWRPDFFSGLWLGLIGFCLFIVVGGVLGRFVGGLLFRTSGGPPRDKKGNS